MGIKSIEKEPILQKENGKKAGLFDLAQYFLYHYPADIFVSEPAEICRIRDVFQELIKKRTTITIQKKFVEISKVTEILERLIYWINNDPNNFLKDEYIRRGAVYDFVTKDIKKNLKEIQLRKPQHRTSIDKCELCYDRAGFQIFTTIHGAEKPIVLRLCSHCSWLIKRKDHIGYRRWKKEQRSKKQLEKKSGGTR